MNQIRTVEKTLQEKGMITQDQAENMGVNNLRVHIGVLRREGYIIDNPKKKTYQLK